MDWNRSDTAVVFIDPQNDVLSPTGINWAATGNSVTENGTVEHMLAIFEAAQANSFGMFISPHYFYPTDHRWLFNGALEADELRTGTFDRPGALNLDGLTGSGADWLEEFKPYIDHPDTVVVSPHKVFGSQTNDLVLQLRKRRINKVLLGGMLANMCVESHLRDLLEQGFEVYVVRDAIAGPRHPQSGRRLRRRAHQLRLPRPRGDLDRRCRSRDELDDLATACRGSVSTFCIQPFLNTCLDVPLSGCGQLPTPTRWPASVTPCQMPRGPASWSASTPLRAIPPTLPTRSAFPGRCFPTTLRACAAVAWSWRCRKVAARGTSWPTPASVTPWMT